MDKFRKNNNLLNGKGEDDIKWITVKGSHIPLKDGQPPRQAIQEHFENMATKKELNSFSAQIDSVLAGTYKGQHITMSQETPKILQDVGIPNKPMLITAKHTYLAINGDGKYTGENDHYHNLGREIFENIPKLLESPILVFQKSKEDIIAIVNAVDKNKNPVIIPIKINGRGKQNFIDIDANIIKSAYGKDHFKNYFKKNITADNLLLVENKKIRNLKN